jgi:hypothetical protein
VRVAGRAGTAVYLIPEGYELTNDENDFAVIVKKGTQVGASEDMPSIDF